MEGAARDKALSPLKPSKFSVYQNPALSAALTAHSLQPSRYALICIFTLSSASALTLLFVNSREKGFIDDLKLKNLSQESAYLFAKVIQAAVGLFFIGTLSSLVKAISLQRARNRVGVPSTSFSKGTKEQACLTNCQLGFLGIKPKVEQVVSDPSRKPPKSKSNSISSPSELLVPLHQSITNTNRSSGSSIDKSNFSGGSKNRSFSTPSKSAVSSPSLYFIPTNASSPMPSIHISPGQEPVISTPWSSRRASFNKEITSEERFEQFLADVDEKITESAGKLTTPPPTVKGFGVASPNTIASSANTSGPTRSTPLRPVRMSPGSQKFNTPPKKGEGDLPPPMSMEESIKAFENLGIYPHVEYWRDSLRQWFSSVLLNPLLNKIETSHIQVMQATAKLGISVTINKVGSDVPTTGIPATVSTNDRNKDWQPSSTLDEDGLLHQLRVTIMQTLDSSMLQQAPQQNPMIPIMRECVDAITEHQRLHALVKGEWPKGLLPQSSVPADYTVQRIRELSEGTCLKNFEYLGSGEVHDKVNKKWTLELPTDSHLLIYLFCAFLEHPKWMLHVDPTSYNGAQSIKNPLFLGNLPPKERFPEKYIAAISSIPSALHPGACVLVVGKQSPPLFALYWDKKLQFSLQGRTALWDSILLLCHRIKVGYGGVVRGMHLGSSALNILTVLDLDPEG